jgi:predicted metal-dependent hydrolase
MDNKITEIDRIGTVKYRKSTRAKYIRITIQKNKGVVVSIPVRCSFDDAERFVLSRLDWIEQSLHRLNAANTVKQTIYKADEIFSTKFRTMRLIPDDRKNMHLTISDKYFDIFYPRDAEIENESVQAIIRKFIEHVWQLEAHEYLPSRLTHLAKVCGLKYRNLTIKNTRSYWGRCDGHNDIILNVHLMHLPDHLIDFVIIHELCHTVHKNHQREFWQLMDVYTSGKAKLLTQEMKNHSTRIY